MEIIQSFWSKPSFHALQTYHNSRKFGGWRNFRDFLISTAFSCLTIRKQHGKITLYTDDDGYGLFLDVLKLPYDEVSLALNTLKDEDHRLWIMGKMIAIKSQDRPFIHVDNDVYIWERFPSQSSSDFLIAQSKFPIWGDYKASLNEIFANFSYIPECLSERPTEKTTVANVGIIGGNDIGFFQEFCDLSRDLLEKNRDMIPLVNVGGFNQMMEEYLFTSMVRHKQRNILYLLEHTKDRFPVSHLHLNLVPFVYRYIHLIGMHKQNRYACEQLALRLKYEFPGYYEKVNAVLRELNDGIAVESLTVRQNKLFRNLNVLYTHTLTEIENLKIVLAKGIEFVPIHDHLGDDIGYVVRETDSLTGETVFKSLPFSTYEDVNYWIRFFTSPATLHDVLDQITTERSFMNEQEIQDFRFRIFDNAMKNIVLVGILEFC